MLKEAMSNTILSNLQVQMLNHSNSKSKIWTPEKTRDHAHFTQPHAENEQAQSSFQSHPPIKTLITREISNLDKCPPVTIQWNPKKTHKQAEYTYPENTHNEWKPSS